MALVAPAGTTRLLDNIRLTAARPLSVNGRAGG